MRPARIAVAGAGVAGAIVARGLAALKDVEVICVERAGATDQSGAGTGLNVGPNAVKALAAHLPALAEAVVAASLPWRRWTVDLTDGRRLFDLDLEDVADNPGVRIRWAELYRVLRDGVAIRHGESVRGVERQADGRLRLDVATAAGPVAIADVDLLLAADGRYSRIREQLVGPPDPAHLGVSLYRVLLPKGPDCPVEDYGQWFNGPNRLLAFSVPGDVVYCAGTFPIETRDGEIPPGMKDPEVLRRLYTPAGAVPCPAAAFLIDGIATRVPEIHWARAQEDRIAFRVPGWPVVFLGDASHPMIPTLGQGATQAVEDACAAIDTVAAVLAEGRALSAVPALIEARRGDRVRFAVDFSRDASDTMLPGSDPVTGTLSKLEPEFQDKLKRLYRDVPMPTAAA